MIKEDLEEMHSEQVGAGVIEIVPPTYKALGEDSHYFKNK